VRASFAIKTGDAGNAQKQFFVRHSLCTFGQAGFAAFSISGLAGILGNAEVFGQEQKSAERLVVVGEVAELLQVPGSWVWRWAKKPIPGVPQVDGLIAFLLLANHGNLGRVSRPQMTHSGVYCVGLPWFVPIKARENKNGQRPINSLTGKFEAFHEQNAGFARSIS
jgi:hypothetical protein